MALEVRSLDFWKALDKFSLSTVQISPLPGAPAMGLTSHHFKHQESYDLLLWAVMPVCPLTESFMCVHDVLLDWAAGGQCPQSQRSWQTAEVSTNHLDFAVRPTWIGALVLPLTRGVLPNIYLLSLSFNFFICEPELVIFLLSQITFIGHSFCFR